MDTFILYGIAIIFFVLSLVKDRKKTKMALKKGDRLYAAAELMK